MSLVSSVLRSRKFLKLFNHNFGLFCFFYFVVSYTSGIKGFLLLKNGLILFTSFVLIGLFGYLINDIFDVKYDKIVHKYNMVSNTPTIYKVLLPILLSVLGLCLITYFSPRTAPLIVLEIIFLLMYSIPAFRIKEYGLLGLIFDSFYAYVIPYFVILSFLSSSGEVRIIFWILLPLFGFLVGLKNILQHQLDDYKLDRISGIKTFVLNNPKYSRILINLFIAISLIPFFLIGYSFSSDSIGICLVFFLPIFVILIKFVFAIYIRCFRWMWGSPDFEIVYYGFFVLWSYLIFKHEYYYYVSFILFILPLFGNKMLLILTFMFNIFFSVGSFIINNSIHIFRLLLGGKHKTNAINKKAYYDSLKYDKFHSNKKIRMRTIIVKVINFI